LPVVGTVPAIKPASAMSKTRAIGVLGPRATVRQAYVDDLAARVAGDCRVILHGSAELVELAEAKLRGESLSPAAFAAVLDGLF
ncbi:glutamate racemase, partial [Paenibacillus polymyxa]|nr:glutamate racemase [Paenibacillus polymyxa]